MLPWQKCRIRHPLYPALQVTRAGTASGVHPVLAGSVNELEAAAKRGARASHAVFVLVPEDGAVATARERERLWMRFQVPSFVLLLDRRGRVAAFECEAQDGFHLAGKADDGDESPLCPCGRPGPRVAGLKRAGDTADGLPLPDRVSAC